MMHLHLNYRDNGQKRGITASRFQPAYKKTLSEVRHLGMNRHLRPFYRHFRVRPETSTR